jgi:aspartate/methionine/tyrosine aminotransferase
VIEAVTSAGSFLDGGGSAPMQRAAAELLTSDHTELETQAIRTAFRAKRDLLIGGLKQLGVRFDAEPEGTFYAWGDLSQLPKAVNTGETFFRAALQRKVITVPGTFFDVDPGQRRSGRPSRFKHHLRFSFGPELSRIETALQRLGEVVAAAG